MKLEYSVIASVFSMISAKLRACFAERIAASLSPWRFLRTSAQALLYSNPSIKEHRPVFRAIRIPRSAISIHSSYLDEQPKYFDRLY